ncbi:MAG: exonuclease subunit SbcD [Treponema sp.]|jgi:exonuclease SbcD|nr:exonuclease subunit SbcD [Treponema sp.]
MLRFLHTSDLHLGKVFHNYSLLEDQRFMLNQLAELLGAYHALVISGDIFDRSIPSSGAAELFSSFLGGIKSRYPELVILIIPGNHDAPLRLAYGRELFEKLGIHIACDIAEAIDSPVMIRAGGICCACFLLPFLFQGSLLSEDGVLLKTQQELAARASEKLQAARQKAFAGGADAAILLLHLFCRSGKKSESERTFLSQAEEVDIRLFSAFDYVALGHLHRAQQPSPNAWYSGSPLSYSFDEAEDKKCFLSVEIDASVRVSPVPVVPLRPLKKLSGSFSFFLKGRDSVLDKAASAYLEITLEGKELTENAKPLLQHRFPYLLLVKQDEAREAMIDENLRIGTGLRASVQNSGGENETLTADFSSFLGEIYAESAGVNAEIAAKTNDFRTILDKLPGEEE